MKRLKKTNEVEPRRVIFPYVLRKQENGSYLALNRRYKPLSFVTYETVKYEMSPIMLFFRGLSKKTREKLSIKKIPESGDIYLYNDATIPTRSKANEEA